MNEDAPTLKAWRLLDHVSIITLRTKQRPNWIKNKNLLQFIESHHKSLKLCFFMGTYPSTSSITASSSDGFASSWLADKQRAENLCLCSRRHFPRIWDLSGQSRKAKELRRCLLPASCDDRLLEHRVKGGDFVQEESWRLLRIEQAAISMATFFCLCFLLIHTIQWFICYYYS